MDLHLIDDAHPDEHDLTLLTQLRADVPPPGDDALVAARLRLTAAMDTGARTATRESHRGRYARRAAVGVAAAVALGLGAYALTGQDPSGPSAPSVRAAGPTTPAPATGTPSAATPHYVDAAQLLDAAAVAALRSAIPAGSYQHTVSHSRGVTTIDDPPAHGAYQFSESRSELWEPARAGDAGYERDIVNIATSEPTAQQRRYVAGLPDPAPREDTWYRTDADGSTTPIHPKGLPEPTCAGSCGSATAWDGPTRHLVGALPTDRTALRASLVRWATALHDEATKYRKPTTVGAIALAAVGTVVGSGYASPALRSALFRVAGTLPGVTLNGTMANFDGVRGTAVSTTDPFDVQQNLIFAADGSAYLGERDVVVHPSAQYHLKAGTVVTWTAVRTDVTGAPTLPRG